MHRKSPIIPVMVHIYVVVLVILLRSLNDHLGQAADADACSPCQMNNLKPNTSYMEYVGPGWMYYIQGAYGTKCYYKFEEDDRSLADQVERINYLLRKAIDLTVGHPDPRVEKYTTKLNSDIAKKKDERGGWREFLSYPYGDDAGCNVFFSQVHNGTIRRDIDPLGTVFNWDFNQHSPLDPPVRELWAKIQDYVTAHEKLPLMAVYSIRGEMYSKGDPLSIKTLEKHREPYRDSFSFCRYIQFTKPSSKFGLCPEQLECGLVNLPALHPLVKNFVDVIQTVLRCLDKEDKGIREDFLEDDELTFEALNKELRTVISAEDLSVLLDGNAIARDFPCLHFNYEFRARVKKNWNLVLQKIGAQKKNMNGIKRHLREALILHVRRRQPALMKKLKDGTKFQLRQLNQNCGCSAPFFKTLAYIEALIQTPDFDDDGFYYELVDPESLDIKDMSERNFFQAFMASCDFGINLECNSKCKCVCPKGAVCSGSSRSFQFPSIKIIALAPVLLVFKHTTR